MNRLDLIIDALERANELWLTEPMGEKAIAAAHELKALKPVAWITRGTFSGRFQMCNYDDIGAFPLYALDEVTK